MTQVWKSGINLAFTVAIVTQMAAKIGLNIEIAFLDQL